MDNHIGKTQSMQTRDGLINVRDPRQFIELLQIGRNGVDWRLALEGEQLARLGNGDRLDHQPHILVGGEPAEPCQALDGDVAIGDKHRRGGQLIGLRSEMADSHRVGCPHVVDGGHHLAVPVEDRQVDTSRSRASFDQAGIDSGGAAGLHDHQSVGIIADVRHQSHLDAKPRQVLRDVAPHPAGRHRDLADIRGSAQERAPAAAFHIHIGAADDNDTRHQKSVGAPPSRLRRSTKSLSSSRIAGSICGSW